MDSPEVQIQWVYTPLDPEAVRWFSYRAPYELKELSKATEIPHRGSLLRFCAADSAALEGAYRLWRDELESHWWEEEATLHSKQGEGAGTSKGSPGAGGGGGDGGSPLKGGAGSAMDPGPDTSDWAYFMQSCADDLPGVLVRGGTFEVDLRCRQLRPCYWPASRHRVLRGTWFAEKGGEWVPLKESLAEQLEEGYRQAIWMPARGRLASQPGGGYAARLELTTHVERGLYALFAAEDEAFLCQETGWGWLRRIGASATAGQTRLRLRRGYEQPASKALLEKEADLRQEELDEAAAAAPVSRLVLVVHGIGQKLAAANIAQDAASFRSVLRQVAQDPSLAGTLNEVAEGRTEVLPVQWRKHLHIEADQLSRQLMPPGIPSLRQTLHSTVVEILLYVSPQHRPGIVTSLTASLNTTYQRFMARNPGFKGTVSILAHSLGTVLCYDVLCNQPGQPPPASPWVPDSPALPMAVSQPASPFAEWAQEGQQQEGQTQQQQWGGEHQQQQQQQQWAGGQQAQQEGEDSMAVDLVATSPTAALQQELSRLRTENQRLKLQLDVARSEPGAAEPRGDDGGGQGGGGWAGTAPAFGSQQQAQQQGAEAAPDSQGYALHLLFTVDQLIMMGSPLGCFLALRGVDPARASGLGSADTAQLMQLAPGLPVTPDGLPAVRRMHNLYHPYDPVAHRLEPLATPGGEAQRAAFVPLFKGGKRIHLAVQEFSEDVGSAASRFGTSLLSSLALAKLTKGSGSSLRQQPATEEAAAAVVEAAREAAEAVAEEEAARQLTGNKSSPALGFGREGEDSGFGREGLLFGALAGGSSADLAPARISGTGSGQLSPELSADGALLPPASPQRLLLLQAQQRRGELARAGSGKESGGSGARCSTGLARVTDGPAVPGARTAQGRLDFAMQESSLENQYLSALSAHFAYWSSPDVALFVLRAVHDLDVLTGASKQQAAAGAAQAQAGAAQAEPGRLAGRRMEPTSPRQHLIALP